MRITHSMIPIPRKFRTENQSDIGKVAGIKAFMTRTDSAFHVPDFAEERISHDFLLGGSVTLKQPVDGYRAAVDAVLLAASVSINSRRDQKILDVGAAVGSAGLCVARRLPDAEVTGVELQDDLYALFCRNIVENDLVQRRGKPVGLLIAQFVRLVHRVGVVTCQSEVIDWTELKNQLAVQTLARNIREVVATVLRDSIKLASSWWIGDLGRTITTRIAAINCAVCGFTDDPVIDLL